MTLRRYRSLALGVPFGAEYSQTWRCAEPAKNVAQQLTSTGQGASARVTAAH